MRRGVKGAVICERVCEEKGGVNGGVAAGMWKGEAAHFEESVRECVLAQAAMRSARPVEGGVNRLVKRGGKEKESVGQEGCGIGARGPACTTRRYR